MKILMVNKFLYPNGGSETYIFKLGEYLIQQGHEVQYFGMEHKERCVGNAINAYTSDMDFHNTFKLKKLIYSIKTIYSIEARKKIRLVLDDFKPDIVHLNNFNYQLTPSIILEIKKWSKDTNKRCKIIYTAHDYQLICPNHMLYNPNKKNICEKCIGGHFINCIKGKCIHGSLAKSVVGAVEAYFWNLNNVYKYIDKVICISKFMKQKLDTNPILKNRTIVIYNFTDFERNILGKKGNYILYFGRFANEKGIKTLIEVCRMLPNINFVFAGSGPLKNLLENIKNINNVGFKSGEDLKKLIQEARFTIVPSEWYEPFGLTIVESLKMGTPVVGSDVGAIPEIIENNKTGMLFKCGDVEDLKNKIKRLWNNEKMLYFYSKNSMKNNFNTIESYYSALIKIYKK